VTAPSFVNYLGIGLEDAKKPCLVLDQYALFVMTKREDLSPNSAGWGDDPNRMDISAILGLDHASENIVVPA
jgi:hypothetical protein